MQSIEWNNGVHSQLEGRYGGGDTSVRGGLLAASGTSATCHGARTMAVFNLEADRR
jgi:hypothetical protein